VRLSSRLPWDNTISYILESKQAWQVLLRTLAIFTNNPNIKSSFWIEKETPESLVEEWGLTLVRRRVRFFAVGLPDTAKKQELH
jgi:hypothetical protein